jgi:hypothetical protein
MQRVVALLVTPDGFAFELPISPELFEDAPDLVGKILIEEFNQARLRSSAAGQGGAR